MIFLSKGMGLHWGKDQQKPDFVYRCRTFPASPRKDDGKKEAPKWPEGGWAWSTYDQLQELAMFNLTGMEDLEDICTEACFKQAGQETRFQDNRFQNDFVRNAICFIESKATNPADILRDQVLFIIVLTSYSRDPFFGSQGFGRTTSPLCERVKWGSQSILHYLATGLFVHSSLASKFSR